MCRRFFADPCSSRSTGHARRAPPRSGTLCLVRRIEPVGARVPGVVGVDDESDIRVLIEAVIERANEGLTVVGNATNGSEAIALWRDTDPYVIPRHPQM